MVEKMRRAMRELEVAEVDLGLGAEKEKKVKKELEVVRVLVVGHQRRVMRELVDLH